RRMREASAMWQAVTDAVGISARDSLWDYPDLMPTAEDIDDPSALVARLQAVERGEQPVADEFDEALARLLDGDDFSEETPSDGGEDGAEDDGDAAPEGDRPV
ncbi:zinc-dependent metalloprotease, partial [Microbacterium sp. AGC62]